MKYLIRVFLFNVFALWLGSQMYPGLVVSGGWQAILSAGTVLSLLMILVQPILKILFIPINILTFGLVSWLINVIVLYLLTLFVPTVQVVAWVFTGFSRQGFAIPSFSLSYTVSLIGASLLLTFLSNFLHWVSEG